MMDDMQPISLKLFLSSSEESLGLTVEPRCLDGVSRVS